MQTAPHAAIAPTTQASAVAATTHAPSHAAVHTEQAPPHAAAAVATSPRATAASVGSSSIHSSGTAPLLMDLPPLCIAPTASLLAAQPPLSPIGTASPPPAALSRNQTNARASPSGHASAQDACFASLGPGMLNPGLTLDPKPPNHSAHASRSSPSGNLLPKSSRHTQVYIGIVAGAAPVSVSGREANALCAPLNAAVGRDAPDPLSASMSATSTPPFGISHETSAAAATGTSTSTAAAAAAAAYHTGGEAAVAAAESTGSAPASAVAENTGRGGGENTAREGAVAFGDNTGREPGKKKGREGAMTGENAGGELGRNTGREHAISLGSYSTVTVGAPAAHSFGFSSGGAAQMEARARRAVCEVSNHSSTP